MRSISISKVIECQYEIKGIEGYVFGKDKQLYNAKTGRKLKHTLNGRSKGYWIGKQFYSHNRLRPLLVKPEKNYCPF